MASVADFSKLKVIFIAVAIVIAGWLLNFLIALYRARMSVKGLPKPPHSFLLGNLRAMGEMVAALPANTHPHTVIHYIRKKYKLPSVFYVDTFPFGWPLMVCVDPGTAQQVTVQTSLPKHHSIEEVIWPIAGHKSLISLQGQEHKKWRSIFNPGFSPAHLMTMVDGIVDDCLVFMDILSKHAAINDVFLLEEATTRVTVDIIGRVVLDVPMHAQTTENPFVRAFRSTLNWLAAATDYNPLTTLNPIRPLVFRYNKRIMDNFLKNVMNDRFLSRGNKHNGKPRSRPVIDLAFDEYQRGAGVSGRVKSINPLFMDAAMQHVKVFMFGGHDTSSSTICYIAYELFKSPAALSKLLAEFDEVFGTDVSQTAAKIRADPHIINRLPYTLAVIKETLRLWPPASSVRTGQPGFFVHYDGKQYPTEDFLVWPSIHAIHLHEKYWSDPMSFKPERWLLKPSDPDYPIKGAWRGFEFGPRNCIGQELAVIEMKIVMALMMREFEIIPAYEEWDQMNNTRGIKLNPEGERAYQVLLATGTPANGMPARAKRR